MSRIKLLTVFLILSLIALLTACSTNPVTGKQELNLIGESQERAIGQKNYAPYRQAQGGDYVADPKLVSYIQSVGQRIAKVSDRRLDYEFRIINDSVPNAWALPGGKIAINRGLLLELHNEAELAAVLSHEIIHAAARHSAKSMERGIFMQGAVLAAGVALADSKYRQLGMIGANLGTGLATMHYSRDAEREADHYGIRYMVRAGYDPQAAVTLQKTFVRLNNSRQPDWLAGLFASHPPSQERVNNNQQLVNSLGKPKGRLGKAAYLQATARLRRAKPAYMAYDQAIEAYHQNNTAQALQLVNKALRIEPKEALFHALRGDIRKRQGRKADALTNYNRAVQHNSSYFRFYLSRGLLQRELNQFNAASRDLQRSLKLLPTAEAHFGLGRIAQSNGQKSRAVQHFSKAATSKSPIGKKAGTLLAQLDLADNPAKYIQTGLSIGRNNNLIIRIKNSSSVKVRSIRVVLGERAGAGIREVSNYRLRKPLSPGREVVLRTKIGPVNPKSIRRFQAFVDRAQTL